MPNLSSLLFFILWYINIADEDSCISMFSFETFSQIALFTGDFAIYAESSFQTIMPIFRKLCMREDGRQQVCIVGLQEFEVSDVQIVKEFIEKGNAARSTGSTGANEESSRSHAILQLSIKKHKEVNETKRHNDGNEPKGGKVIGKISFIDLAGSERGADTTDNDRQTRFVLALVEFMVLLGWIYGIADMNLLFSSPVTQV